MGSLQANGSTNGLRVDDVWTLMVRPTARLQFREHFDLRLAIDTPLMTLTLQAGTAACLEANGSTNGLRWLLPRPTASEC